MVRALVTALLLAAACGGKTKPELTASGPKLPPPRDIDPRARGAAYLTAVANIIQPQWGQFLEDCRLRLPATHPLNQPSLVATAELVVGADGKLDVRIATGSGNGDFDTAVFDVLSDVSPLPAPPPELASDDELVHLTWLFARDARQAGPATAEVADVKLPLLVVVDKLIARKLLSRAVARVAIAKQDPDRTTAIDRVMTATLGEALYSSDGAARRAAVEAIARAKVTALVTEVHTLAGPIDDRDLRLVAIRAIASWGAASDRAAVSVLAADLATDLENRPQIALAKIEALVALGRGDLAAPSIKGELAKGPTATGLAALALVPDPEVAPKLQGWLGSTDAGTRAAVCAALPSAAPDNATALIGKGLRDADATVRARCVGAAGRTRIATDGPIMRRLQELARDRDRAVRARAIAVLGVIKPDHKLRAIDDPASEVRAASAIGAGEATLRTLAEDKDPDVRAVALGALGDRAVDIALRHVGDLSAAVRKTALSVITDQTALMKLATDDSPDVATAALVRLAQLRGRAAIGDLLLANLAGGPPPATRVRIALAWLLAH